MESNMDTGVTNPPTKTRNRRRADHTQANEAAQAGIPAHEIARRAYELFAERGAVHGHDIEDWLAAERELTRGRKTES
jgi:hypothetical protein